MSVFLREVELQSPPVVPIFKPFSYVGEDAPLQTFNGTELSVVDDGTLVLGACAGSGKTSTCIANAVGHTLIVSPTNKRIAELQQRWATKRHEFSEDVTEVVALTTARTGARRKNRDRGGGKGGDDRARTAAAARLRRDPL